MTSYIEIKKQIEELRDENSKSLPQLQIDRAVERIKLAEKLGIKPPTVSFVADEIELNFNERGNICFRRDGGCSAVTLFGDDEIFAKLCTIP